MLANLRSELLGFVGTASCLTCLSGGGGGGDVAFAILYLLLIKDESSFI